MRILIFGAGVIGSLYGTMLAEAGYDVSIYARGRRPGSAPCFDRIDTEENMKKLFNTLLVALLALCLVACSGGDDCCDFHIVKGA